MYETQLYSEETRLAVKIAQSIAKEYHNAEFSAGHLLQGILHNDVGLASYLASIGTDIHYLRDWAEIRIEMYPKAGVIAGTPSGDTSVMKIFEVADVARLKLSEDTLTPLCVLVAMTKPGVAFTEEQLKSFPLTETELLQANIKEQESIEQAINPGASSASSHAATTGNALLKFCVDKTALAREGKVDPIVGRERETRMIAEILGRRTKPNVIVVGDPGVGKTALIDGFALDIVAGKVPAQLQNAIVFELDIGSLIAGASYKGEVEERLKSIIAEVKQFDKAILFIDEIHALLDSNGAMGNSAANLLKPELARGELTVIGATTNDEYRQYIEKDEAFSRRFERLQVDEPDIETAYRMMQVLLPLYIEHHKVQIEDKAIWDCIRLAKRYIKDRRLPDASIDLMDRTMAAIKLLNETSKTELSELVEELDRLSGKSKAIAQEGEALLKEVVKKIDASEVLKVIDSIETEAVKDPKKQLQDLQWFYRQCKNRLSPILLSQNDDETDVSEFKQAEEYETYLRKYLADLDIIADTKKEIVAGTDVAAVVARRTGIPLGKIQTREREKLLNMEAELKRRVVGQDHALKVLAEAILESRAGLTKAGQPIGSFFFSGPTGTGKTELAKTLAEFLFNDENALIRFDMSEFKEEHSAALLYGAPPGYVGYEQGGLLVNKIRQQPYAVVLFDEIEKAHRSVFDIFLQLLDEGKITDKLDREGDFSNAIILFTSNIGSKWIEEQFAKGIIPASNDILDLMGGHFRPEFLGRITEIVPFRPIGEDVLLRIFEIQTGSLLKMLAKQGITLNMTDEVKAHIAELGFNPKYGARPLKSMIRAQLRRPISRMIIAAKVGKGSIINLSLNEDKSLKWDITDTPATEEAEKN